MEPTKHSLDRYIIYCKKFQLKLKNKVKGTAWRVSYLFLWYAITHVLSIHHILSTKSFTWGNQVQTPTANYLCCCNTGKHSYFCLPTSHLIIMKHRHLGVKHISQHFDRRKHWLKHVYLSLIDTFVYLLRANQCHSLKQRLWTWENKLLYTCYINYFFYHFTTLDFIRTASQINCTLPF